MTRHFGLFCTMLFASVCYAQSWVSTNGNDTGTCTRSAPCRTFQYAIEHTAAGGQIDVGEAGDFGTAVITTSMTIDGGNFAANVSPSSGYSISIVVQAGPKDVINLRNMTLLSTGTGQTNGVAFYSGSQLIVENVKVAGFAAGISADIQTATTPSDLVIRNSAVDNCGEAISLASIGSNLTVEIVDTNVTSAVFGLLVYEGRVRVSGSTFSGTTNSTFGQNQSGIQLESSGFPQQVMVDNCEISGYPNGILLHAGTLTLSRSTVAFATTGVSATAGTLITNGNNSFFGNTTDGTFTKTVALR
jgi:hypothetical protein